MTITRFACLFLLSVPGMYLAAQTKSVLPDAPDTVLFGPSSTPAIDAGSLAIPAEAAGIAHSEVAAAARYAATEEFSSSASEWLDESDSTDAVAHPSQGNRQRYPYGKLFWQSLEFTGAEDLYRLSTDPYMRHLIADAPYWHDYIESMKQWNMRRWNDGDDFLVDYIGHPMQGSVSGFIQIQNSPHDKYLRLSGSREYWRSRFHAMLWATVFSTQQKIGPLGEAALGNAGGYTYALHCPYPCRHYVPGVTKYTNNTGWTDFITTPTIGTLWIVFEDFLDKEVSDRIADHLPGVVAGHIIRGSLNPTRTMANFFRGKNPWYRDYDHRPDMAAGEAAPVGREEKLLGEGSTGTGARIELFPHLDAISLPVNTPTCNGPCRRMLYGPGIGFSSRLTHFVDFDSDVSMHSDASPLASDRAGGSVTIGTFGFRSGIRTERFALRASIRPGFLSYDKALESSPSKQNPTPSVGRITHFTTALAVSTDLNLGRHLAARFVILNLPVRYREAKLRPTAPGVGTPPYFDWLSKQVFATNENWGYQTGLVMRF